MTIWFTSDHHFWHKNIITYCNRPYKSIEEMNKALIDRWNERIKPEDTVYYLGDFSMSMRGLDQIVSGLTGKKILVPGNHDACHPANKRRAVSFREYRDLGFERVILETTIDLNLRGKDVKVKLCHLPYEPDQHEKADRRYLEMRPKDEGQLLLHGHVHCAWRVVPEKRMINVGVDVHDYYPISVADIDKLVTESNMQI
jgi:calcineurin-like phosphoesterase family protein